MKRALLVTFLMAISLSVLAADGPVPTPDFEKDVVLKAKTNFSEYFTLTDPKEVHIKATVRSAQPVSFYVLGMEEYKNYIAVVGSLEYGNFSHVKELFREATRDMDQSCALMPGTYALVVTNPGPKDADMKVSLATADPVAQKKLVSLPKTLAGLQGTGQGAGRYELTITRYVVSKNKVTGEAWDAGDNTPDVVFMLKSGEGTGVRSLERPKGKKHQDAPVGKGPNEDTWVFDWDGKNPVVMFAYDADVMSDDLIGEASINQGQQPAREWVIFKVRGGKIGGKVAVTLAWRRLGDLAKGF